MRNYFLILLAICFSTFAHAHKDKQKLQTHGNIKTFCRATFHYSVFEKVTAIGILSEKLAKELNYKDTLLIEVRKPHFETFKDDNYRFDMDNSAYQFLFESYYEAPYKAEGMSIRIQAKDINVTEVLKLVEFAILNKKKLNKMQLTEKIYDLDDNKFLGKYRYIPKEQLIKIWSNQSDLITKIINEKVPLLVEDELGLGVYWQNNNFIFGHNYKKGKIDNEALLIPNYYYFTSKGLSGLIFLNNTQFYHMGYYKNQFIENTEPMNLPVLIENELYNKLIFFNDRKMFLLLIDKKKVISDFENCQ